MRSTCLAFRAALIAIQQHNESGAPPINSLTCPAPGAGIGGMPFDRVARQMLAAYSAVELGETSWLSSARGVLRHNASLLK
jgi:O-acetyl-ADP-ribose deacetylase (regulator of RNase III)